MPTFTYRIATPSDHEKIVKFLGDYFYHEEIYTRSTGASWDHVRPFFAELAENCLKKPLSIIVTVMNSDFSLNSNNDVIVGVLLNSVWKRSENSENQNVVVKKKLTFGETLHRCQRDFWNLAPSEINTVIYREVSSVGGPWQRQGIASKMSQMILNLSRTTLEVGGIASATTSLANQNLLAKQGFSVLKEYPYSEIVNSQGEPLKMDDGTEVIQLNFRLLSS